MRERSQRERKRENVNERWFIKKKASRNTDVYRREKKREGSDGFHEYKFKCGFIIFISNLFH